MIRIHVNQFAFLTETMPESDSGDLECSIGFHASDRKVSVSMKFVFLTDKPVMMIEATCQFAVEDDSWGTMRRGNDKVILPQGFLSHIAMHTVGTIRGILHCKTEGTPFNALILPPINVSEMVTGDLELPISE